jgi:hypothetical protein
MACTSARRANASAGRSPAQSHPIGRSPSQGGAARTPRPLRPPHLCSRQHVFVSSHAIATPTNQSGIPCAIRSPDSARLNDIRGQRARLVRCTIRCVCWPKRTNGIGSVLSTSPSDCCSGEAMTTILAHGDATRYCLRTHNYPIFRRAFYCHTRSRFAAPTLPCGRAWRAVPTLPCGRAWRAVRQP